MTAVMYGSFLDKSIYQGSLYCISWYQYADYKRCEYKVLRIPDVYPGSRILILSIPDSGSNNSNKRGGENKN